MVIPLSLILQFVGIFAGVKLLKLDIGVLGISVLTFIPVLATSFIPGLTGFVVACVVFFVALKMLDGAAGFVEAVGIVVISLSTQAGINHWVVDPSLNRLLTMHVLS